MCIRDRVDKGCILRIFPDKLEGSKTSLILKDTKTEASCRTIFMTAALREELKQWLERLKREEALDPERYLSLIHIYDVWIHLRLPRRKFQLYSTQANITSKIQLGRCV